MAKQERFVPEISALQRLQDQFAGLLGCTLALYGPHAQLRTRVSNHTALYHLLREEPVYQGKTIEIVLRMCSRSGESNQPEYQHWPELGCAIVCVPAGPESEVHGCWMLGPVRTVQQLPPMPPELQHMAPALVEALAAIPVMEQAQLCRAAKFLQDLCASVLEAGNRALQALQQHSALTRTNQELDTAVQMLRHSIEASEVAICISDLENGEILMANGRFAQLTGVPLPQLLENTSMQVAEICFEEQKSGLFCPLGDRVLDENGKPLPPITWQSHAVASGRYIRSTSQAIRWVDGRFVHLNTMVDITAERQMRHRLEALAYRDSLLGLPNQHKLENDLHLRREARRAETWLVCLDIVALRRINHAYGRKAGDALLAAVALWLDSHGHGRLYRCGSDTFVLRLHNGTLELARQVACEIAERFDASWRLRPQTQRLELYCTISMAILGGEVLFGELSAADGMYSLVERALDVARRKRQPVEYTCEMDLEERHHNRLELGKPG